MTTPTYWRRPSFSVAETADMIGSTEDALRTWIARNPIEEFAGEKQANRVWLTGRDGFYYRLVLVLSAFGVPVRTAMYTAGSIAEFGEPHYRYLLVERGNGTTTFRSSDTPSAEGPALLLPLHELYHQHLAICADRYQREAR